MTKSSLAQSAKLAVIGALILMVASCGGSSSVTIHGTLTPSSGASGVFGAGMTATTYGLCATANPTPGTQVTVTDSSGKVIGTGELGLWKHDHSSIGGTTIYQCDMPFMIKDVPSEPRYGFQINGVPGTIWESSTTVSLDVSSGS